MEDNRYIPIYNIAYKNKYTGDIDGFNKQDRRTRRINKDKR